MLAHRIIPTLLKRGDSLVKGVAFDSWRVVGHVEQAARIHQARGVDELCILDITATREKRDPDLEAIERLTAGCFMPITVGGGVRTLEHVRGLLNAGADKIVIRTAGNGLIREAANIVGCQAIVAAIDVTTLDHNPMECSPKLLDVVTDAALRAQDAGAGEILLTRCEREGRMAGYDLPLINRIAQAVDVPVIAHGGCGTYHHMLEAIKAGASAVAAGSMFQFTDQTPRGAAQYLHQHGIEVRI